MPQRDGLGPIPYLLYTVGSNVITTTFADGSVVLTVFTKPVNAVS